MINRQLSVNMFQTKVVFTYSYFLYLALIFALVIPMGLVHSFVAVAAVLVGTLAHEFGHIFTARYFDVSTGEIRVNPAGAFAMMNVSEISSYKAEFFIAFMGPATNLILALLAGVPYLLGADFLRMFVVMNVVFGVLNLAPIYPADGGRILNAILKHLGKNERFRAKTDFYIKLSVLLVLAIPAYVFIGPLVVVLIALLAVMHVVYFKNIPFTVND